MRSPLAFIRTFAVLSALWWGLEPPAQAQTFMVTDLGTLGGSSSHAYGMNRFDEVVGYSTLPDPFSTPHAFFWTPSAGMMDIGTLGGSYAVARDINNTHQVVGDSSLAGDLLVHAFRWQAGVMTDLGTLGGVSSIARAINSAGVVAGHSQGTDNFSHAFSWESGIMTDLGTLGGRQSYAEDINELAQIAGRAENAAYESHAVIWENGLITDLGTLGGTYSESMAINNLGQVVGRSTTLSDGWHVFLWSEGVMTDLGDLGTEPQEPSPSDFNDRGIMVGKTTIITPLSVEAFIWRNGVQMLLNNLIPGYPEYDLWSADGINRRGRICGGASVSGLGLRAVLLTPRR